MSEEVLDEQTGASAPDLTQGLSDEHATEANADAQAGNQDGEEASAHDDFAKQSRSERAA